MVDRCASRQANAAIRPRPPRSAMTTRLVRVILFAFLALFFWKSFLPGWTQQTTDFPNYFTAARLVQQPTPLHLNYDWMWFQRQMDRAGIADQLGGYIPQTPLAMLPFIPLSSMAAQTAKRCWLVLNLLFLALTVHFLSLLTGYRRAWLWLLIFACWEPLRANFLLGQYYIFLLLLFTLSAYALARHRDTSSGVLAGIIFGLKLYGAPLLIWFAARRRWRAVIGMAVSSAFCISLALAVFGWRDVAYFATQILPRALQGETLNPFHPGNGTLSTLLRVTFMAEPELNPRPLINSPGAFFFLQPLVTLIVLALPLLSAASLAWFLIALLLASPNTASYTFVVLALPVALLLQSSPRGRWPWLLIPYIAIGLPMPSAWTWAFPRLWLLLALYTVALYNEAGRGHWKAFRRKWILAVSIVIIDIAAASALLQIRAWKAEPGSTLAAISTPDAIYSAFPVASPAGIVYQSIAQGRYLLRRRHNGTIETFAFPGQAFTPSVPDSGGPIYFELVAGGVSRIAAFDPDSGRTEMPPLNLSDPRAPAISHDGKLLALVSGDALFLFDGATTRKLQTPIPAADPSFVPGDRGIVFSVSTPQSSQVYVFDLDTGGTREIFSGKSPVARPSISPGQARLLFASRETGSWQIWVADIPSRYASRLTGGNCNNSMPAWGSAPGQIVFASDCGRGLGLPALYRIDHVADALAERLDPETAFPLHSSGNR